MSDFWSGKRVFVSGHTGFKGGWLSLWLASRGAEVHGFALDPPTDPSLFCEAGISARLAGHTIGDVRDPDALRAAITAARPDVVFHLAAQPLVRLSYAQPAETYATNVMGTVNLLEAVRATDSVQAVVNVTTDKCYENKEWAWGYREVEPLGGHDPYSSSKAASELVTSAYRNSFFGGGPWLASARAGNVIGGGDWALDRLVPDILRALDANAPISVRHPGATRPWQHVLEPVSGYILLAERLATQGRPFARAWNFGPEDVDARPVGWILEKVRSLRPELTWHTESAPGVHEANFLKLDSSDARALLGWQPRWHLETALQKTVEWHDAWRRSHDMAAVSIAQISEYEAAEANG